MGLKIYAFSLFVNYDIFKKNQISLKGITHILLTSILKKHYILAKLFNFVFIMAKSDIHHQNKEF